MSFTKKSYPLDVHQCPHQTTQYNLMMHYVKSGDKRRREQLEYLVQKNAGTDSKHLRKLPVKKYTCVGVSLYHQSSPIIMVCKQRSYTFTPAFSFMACTGTALTSSLGYRNLNCRRVPKYGTYMYIFTLIYVGWSFNSKTDFFVSKWADLTASWSSVFQVVSLCLYALIPAFLSLTKAPLVVTFCNSPQMSHHVSLNLFNVIESATFHCFLQLREQKGVAWSKVRGVGRVCERRNFVFRQKFICGDMVTALWAGAVMVQDPIAGAPLLRAMSAHSFA